jgi:hypothetical protein
MIEDVLGLEDEDEGEAVEDAGSGWTLVQSKPQNKKSSAENSLK